MTKVIDTKLATQKLFSNTDNTDNTQDTHDTQTTQTTQGTEKPGKKEKLRSYRYNLLLDNDLNDFLHFAAWKNKTSMTQYINDIIRGQHEAYLKECEETGKTPFEGWID